MTTRETEIRRLEPIALNNLGQILNQQSSWKKLMSLVTKDDRDDEYLFTSEHFTMIENAIHEQKKSGAEIFLTEWSTMGRKRPTCGKLLDLLVKAELFRAAEYLAVHVLKQAPPERPKYGPAAKIVIPTIEELLRQQADLASDSEESCSFHVAEKPAKLVSVAANAAADLDEERSDLIKLIQDDVNLMQSNELLERKRLRDLPENISDFMIFKSDEMKAKAAREEQKSYVLQEAKSEMIPVFVKEKNSCLPSCTKELEISEASSVVNTETTIESSDVSEDMQVVQESGETPYVPPAISQNIIPLVVFEFNQREMSNN